MAIDIWGTLRAGSVAAIDLLEYSVISVQPEIVFGYLVTEFQTRPDALRALALYDVFCAPDAAARIDVVSVLPPRNLRLAHAIQRMRDDVARVEAHNAGGPQHTMLPTIPGKFVFDTVLAAIQSPGHERMRRIAETYDPSLTPVENLPGGTMTAGQRLFVDRVWRSRLRPRLVASGFPRLSSIGG